MRKLSVLTVMALMAGTAFSAAVDVSDPPDIRLMTGAAGSNVFDLNNYYGTSNAGAPTFAGAGLTIANGVVSVPGASAVGSTNFAITITVGGTAGNTAISRKVSSGLLAGAPMADDNLYLTSQSAASNVFLNCLKAGTAKTSAVALTGGPSGGGSGSPSGGSPSAGGASWYITFGTVNTTFAASGLLQRTSAVTAGPTLNTLTAGGLTASIDAAGQYTLSSDATFQGPVVVTFVKKAGSDLDSASVLASANVSVGANYAFNDLDGTASTGVIVSVPTAVTFGATLARNPAGFTNGKGLVVNAAAGQTVQIFFPEVAVSGNVEVSVNAWALQAGATISVAAVDPTLLAGGANTLTYAIQAGSAVAADSPRKLTANLNTALTAGKLIPVLQVVGPGTVEFDNLAVCRANPITRYAFGATEVDLVSSAALGGSGAVFAGDFSGGLAGLFLSDIAGSGLAYTAPVVSTGNNFATAGTAQSARLAGGAAGVSNFTAGVAGLDSSAVVSGTAFAKKVSGAAGGFLAVALISLDGGTNNATFVDQSALSTAAFTEASVTAAFQSTAGGVIFVVQAASGLTADVDDIAAYAVQDLASYFDATLLGGL